MMIKSGLRSIIITSVLTLFTLHSCFGQSLLDRSTNTISDRSFQNTLLSRQPISPTRSSDRGRTFLGTNLRGNGGGPRVRMISLPSVPPATGSRPRITVIPSRGPARGRRIQTPSRQIRIRQTRIGDIPGRTRIGPITSGRSSLIRPTSTRQLSAPRQTGGALGSIRRRTMARQLSRRLSGNRQAPRSGVQFRPGPLRRNPQTGLLIQSISAQPRRTTVSNREPRALGPIPRCAANARYTCRAFPRTGDRRRARRCVGFCGPRRCVGMCLCACVTQRPTNRRREPIRNRITDLNLNRLASGATPSDLNFTVDNSILARMLGEPDLNSLVGPDGINQILRGEPPVLRIPDQQRSSVNNASVRATTPAPVDMGVPIPLGLTPAPLGPIDPILANMLVSGENMGEVTSEIGSEILRIPSLTEFQRPNMGSVTSLNAQPRGQATNLDANFFGAILPMPTPISQSRDTTRDRQRSRDRTNVVVNPTLLDAGVIKPVRGFRRPRRPLRTLERQARVLENALDANFQPFDSISDVLSGSNMERAALRDLNMLGPGSARGRSRDRRLLDSVIGSSGNQEPSEVALMAAMMTSLGGAVDAVSAANSRNRSNSARMENLRNVAGSSGPRELNNQTNGNLIQNFLSGTVKGTDQSMTQPTESECFAQGQELWCDPIGVWESTPGISRWCRTNCAINSSMCDLNRCDCKCVEPERFRQNLL